MSRECGFRELWIYLEVSPAPRSQLDSGFSLLLLHLPIKLLRGEINGPNRNCIYLPRSVGGGLCRHRILPAMVIIVALAPVGSGCGRRNSQHEPEGPPLGFVSIALKDITTCDLTSRHVRINRPRGRLAGGRWANWGENKSLAQPN